MVVNDGCKYGANMVVYECPWVFMSVYGYLWVSWVSMGVYGSLWMFMGIYECLWASWVSIGIYRFLWVSMGGMGVYGYL